MRIKHTYILDDPFEYPPQLAELIPENSPLGNPHDEVAEERLEDSWVPLDETVDPDQLEIIRSKEAHADEVILESVGDFPDATGQFLICLWTQLSDTEFQRKEGKDPSLKVGNTTAACHHVDSLPANKDSKSGWSALMVMLFGQATVQKLNAKMFLKLSLGRAPYWPSTSACFKQVLCYHGIG